MPRQLSPSPPALMSNRAGSLEKIQSSCRAVNTSNVTVGPRVGSFQAKTPRQVAAQLAFASAVFLARAKTNGSAGSVRGPAGSSVEKKIVERPQTIPAAILPSTDPQKYHICQILWVASAGTGLQSHGHRWETSITLELPGRDISWDRNMAACLG